MRRSVVWIILILLLLLRVFFYTLNIPTFPDGTRIRITGKIKSEPIRYDYSQRVTLQNFKFYLPKYPETSYGDEIVVEGLVDDRELKKTLIVEIRESKNTFYRLRKKLVEFFQKALPQPHSSLIAGMTLGSKVSIPKDFWESLKSSGTAHVVVASGMNVTLVAGFLMNMLTVFVNRRKAVVLALIGIWLYAVIAGFDAPIVRAAIMGSIAFSAQALGRVNEAWRGLFLSALFILIIKPEWTTDLGFILSFIATASLMLFEKRIEKRIKFIPSPVREDLSTSLAAQIGVAPILFVTFGQFNLLSPVINAAILWTVAPITMIGMFAAILSLLSIQLGRLFLLLSYPLSSWFVWIVQMFG